MEQDLILPSLPRLQEQVPKTHNNRFRDSDFAKAITETFKSLDKSPLVGKRLAGVTSTNTRLIEEGLLPMLTAVDSQSGEIVTQINNFHDYFPNKQAITPESKGT
jgi:hypothetical protein